MKSMHMNTTSERSRPISLGLLVERRAHRSKDQAEVIGDNKANGELHAANKKQLQELQLLGMWPQWTAQSYQDGFSADCLRNRSHAA